MSSKSTIKRISQQVKHAEGCNTEHPCLGCHSIPKHKYSGPVDRADCKICGYSIDMPCHETGDVANEGR